MVTRLRKGATSPPSSPVQFDEEDEDTVAQTNYADFQFSSDEDSEESDVSSDADTDTLTGDMVELCMPCQDPLYSSRVKRILRCEYISQLGIRENVFAFVRLHLAKKKSETLPLKDIHNAYRRWEFAIRGLPPVNFYQKLKAVMNLLGYPNSHSRNGYKGFKLKE